MRADSNAAVVGWGAACLAALLTVSGRAQAEEDVEGFRSCPESAAARILVIKGIELLYLEEEGQPLLFPEVGHGTGTVIREDGLILTAKHVVEGATGIAVWMPNARRPVAARLVYSDELADFAFIKVAVDFNDDEIASITDADTSYRRGDPVISWGYPIDVREPTPDLLRGNIRKTSTVDRHLEVSCQFDPGISGGPVCGEKGLIGVAIAREGHGRNYAVPISEVVNAYRHEVERHRLVDRVDKDMSGEEWEAYKAYAELSARLTINYPAYGKVDEKFQWLIGEREGADGTNYYQEFSNLEKTKQSPEAKLVIAAFYWNDRTVRMWRRGCEQFECMTETELSYQTSAVGMLLNAVEEKPELEIQGGSAVRKMVQIARSVASSEDSDERCGDGVDNDGDGNTDCGDDGCKGTVPCGGTSGTKAPARAGVVNEIETRNERPRSQWSDWENQFVPYGGFLFPTPVGSDTDVDLWGTGFLYQRRMWGMNVAKWFHFDLVLGVDGFLHSWGSSLHDAGGSGTKIPDGFAFGLGFQPTVRVVLGVDFGIVLEGYYPFTVLFADPVSVAYQVWGVRGGVFFGDAFTIGLMLHELVPSDETFGLWGLMIMMGF